MIRICSVAKKLIATIIYSVVISGKSSRSTRRYLCKWIVLTLLPVWAEELRCCTIICSLYVHPLLHQNCCHKFCQLYYFMCARGRQIESCPVLLNVYTVYWGGYCCGWAPQWVMMSCDIEPLRILRESRGLYKYPDIIIIIIM